MTTLRFVRSVWESFRATSGLEPRLLDNLRVTAARPGTVNFELDIQKEHTEVTCDKFGKTLAYTNIKFMNSKGEVFARGSHTKYAFALHRIRQFEELTALTGRYIALAWKDPKNIVEELDGRKES
ncbi:PaaI_thioesterase family protein [Aspergillus fumigatus Z5]|nr:PaaI_thioesterase family protein [Aspergillus fumigatus Z5]